MFKAAKTPSIPALRDVLPELGEALDLRETILAELRQKRDEYSQIQRHLAAGNAHFSTDARVQAILDGATVTPPVEIFTENLGKIQQRIRDLEAATEHLHNRIHTLEGRASAKVCDQFREQHRKLATAVCQQLVELHRAHADFDALYDTLTDHGVSVGTLPRLNTNMLGSPRDPYSPLAHALREAAADALFEKANIPADIR